MVTWQAAERDTEHRAAAGRGGSLSQELLTTALGLLLAPVALAINRGVAAAHAAVAASLLGSSCNGAATAYRRCLHPSGRRS